MQIELTPAQEAALMTWLAQRPEAEQLEASAPADYELCLAVTATATQARARKGASELDLGEVQLRLTMHRSLQSAPPKAARFVEMLKRFNAKERNFLMRYALCPAGPPALSSRFIADLLAHLRKIGIAGLDGIRPVYFGMDYHLEWIHAALCISNGMELNTSAQIEREAEVCVEGVAQTKKKAARIEDVDLLLVLQRTDGSLLMVLIEAKGASYFGTKQLRSKAARLKTLRASHGDEDGWLTSILLLMSPAEFAPSAKTRSDVASVLARPELRFWPEGVGEALLWMPLVGFFDDLQHPSEALRVSTCYAKGVRAENLSAREALPYTHWKAEPRLAASRSVRPVQLSSPNRAQYEDSED